MPFGRGSRYSGDDAPGWLIVGLGNPGPKYRDTPHNIGFDVVDELARRAGVKLAPKFDGMFARAKLAGERVALLEPLTYMNLSGRSVRPASAQLAVPPDRVLVVHDEVDIPFADLRVKFGGGLAGHNGLRSITDLLRTQDFARLRVGVGRPAPGDRRPLADWILARWDTVTEDVAGLRLAAADAVELIVAEGLEPAMNRINRTPAT